MGFSERSLNFSKNNPEEAARFARIIGLGVLAVVGVAAFLFAGAVVFTSLHNKELEREEQTQAKGDRELIAAVEERIARGGQVSDLDEEDLRAIEMSYSRRLQPKLSNQIEQIRKAKFPKYPSLTEVQIEKEAEVLQAVPEVIQVRH